MPTPFNRIKSLPWTLAFCLIQACAIGCAEIATPTGGPKDTEGPTVALQSPEQEATEVRPNKIVITYNEFIALKDAFNQVLISPPLDNEPEYQVKGRRLEITLNDTLLDNRTYLFFLGDAVRDLNEGNVVQRKEIVFSTGPIIDSLSLSGTLIDALTEEPVEKALVMLHADANPASMRENAPTYATRTDKSGSFRFQYLASGDYALTALVDANFNYRYDLPNETIAFNTLPIALKNDTALGVPLRSFVEENGKGALVKARSPAPWQVNASFNGSTDTNTLSWTLVPSHIQWNATSDSVKAWFQGQTTDTVKLVQTTQDTTITRSVFIKREEPDAEADQAWRIKHNISSNAESKGSEVLVWTHSINKPLVLAFPRPIQSVDTNVLQLLIDSSNVALAYALEWLNASKTSLSLSIEWPPKTSLRINIPAGTFTDAWNGTNDSLLIRFTTTGRDNYGTMNWTFIDSSNTQFIAQLLNAQDAIVDERVWQNQDVWNIALLPAGAYRLRMIEDRNRNRKWDPGTLETLEAPEAVEYFKETLNLRAGWTLDYIW